MSQTSFKSELGIVIAFCILAAVSIGAIFIAAHRSKPGYKLLAGVGVALPTVALVSYIFSQMFHLYLVPSGSMLPTYSIGSHIIVNQLSRWVDAPLNRGEVIVFRPIGETSNAAKKDTVKRIIGMPGDVIRYENGLLTVNQAVWETSLIKPVTLQAGAPSKDEYAQGGEYSEQSWHIWQRTVTPEHRYRLMQSMTLGTLAPCATFEGGFTCRIPENYFFVMGDNRDESSDSRSHGLVNRIQVAGRVIANF